MPNRTTNASIRLKGDCFLTTHVVAGAAAALLGAPMFNVNSFAAEPAAHEHPAEAHQLMLDAGRKRATGEPLRKGMGEICKVVAADLNAIHAGHEALATIESVDMGQGFSSPLRIT